MIMSRISGPRIAEPLGPLDRRVNAWREDLAALKAAGFGGLVILEINGYRASKLPGLQGLLAQSFAAMTEAIA